MKNQGRYHQAWGLLVLAMLLGSLWLSGCRSQDSASIRTVQPYASQVSHTPLPLSPQTSARLVYMSDQALWEGSGVASDRLIAELPLAGIHAAALLDESLILLAQDELLQVDLTSGAIETVAEIETTVRWGDLLLLRDQRAVVYAAIADAADGENAWAGFATHVGLYDVRARQAFTLTVLAGQVSLLGVNIDGDVLYVMRYGGDGGFAAVWGVDLEDGAIREEVMAGGFAAAVSPDGRWLAVAGEQFEQQGYLVLYDLMQPDAQPMAVALTPQPSQARSLVWAPDSQHLYFILHSGTFTDPGRSYGVWELEPFSGDLKQITQSVRAESKLLMVSPDGRMLLIDNARFEMVDVQTGSRWPFDLAPETQILTWLEERPR